MLSNLTNENDYINNLHRKALLYLNEKKLLRSEKIYIKILKKNSNDNIALLNLGVIDEKLEKYIRKQILSSDTPERRR